MSDQKLEPSEEEINRLVNLAKDLPSTDVCYAAWEVQAVGRNTAGGRLLRRMIAEVVALRATVHRMRRGE